MSINLNDIINYGTCKFKVVKYATLEDVNRLQNQLNNLSTIPYSNVESKFGK